MKKQFEYRIEKLGTVEDLSCLNDLGKEGWELIQNTDLIYSENIFPVYYVFKREI